MSVRVLSTSEARTLLDRHSLIKPEIIPSWGVWLEDDVLSPGFMHDYLVGIIHETGEVKILDITAYNSLGDRIDPITQSGFTFANLWREIENRINPLKLGTVPNLILIGVLIWGASYVINSVSNLRKSFA